VTDLMSRLGMVRPVMQAGMGGGVATSALAAVVSDGGGLGTIGILPPDALRAEIAAVRALTSKPLAVNVMVDGMPLATVDTHPLYAGETVARITEIRPAATVLNDLTP
jgi:nitronate monooxygenase